jgi:uncharacterized protein (DUF2147 family)
MLSVYHHDARLNRAGRRRGASGERAMKKIACILGLAVVGVLAATAGWAQSPEPLVGTWLNGDKTAHIEIYKQANKYFGKIVWLKEPTYPANDEKGMAGKEKVDRENPDPAKRRTPVLGLVILRDFTYVETGRYENGRIYDPKNGKDYKCKITQKSPDALDVRGYIGFSFIGRTDSWTRVKGTT